MKGLILTWVLCYGGAFVSLFQPFVGLLVYVCFALIKPESVWYWSVRGGNYSRIVAIALLLGWVLQGCGDWRLGKARAIVFALLGFWLWLALGAAQATDPEVAWTAVEALSKIFLPFVVGITLLDSVKKIKLLAWVILLSQGYVAFDANINYLQGFNKIQAGVYGNMDNNSIAIAMVANTGLGFFLGLHASRLWQKLLAFGLAACSAHAVLFSLSRGGMLALIITGVLAFFMIPKQPKHYAIFLLAVLLGLRLAGPEVRERFSTTFAGAEERDASAGSRLALWADCWDCMVKHPVFGLGPDHWPLEAPEYGWPAGKEAHTLWLQIGAENGFPGLLLLLSFFGLVIVRLWPYMRRQQMLGDPWFQDCPSMVCASLIGFAVAAQFVSLWSLELPYYVALVGAGTLKLATLPHDGAETGPILSSAGPQEPLPVSSAP
jgi:putative inorganic carbon (HCO3(-)) transporter